MNTDQIGEPCTANATATGRRVSTHATSGTVCTGTGNCAQVQITAMNLTADAMLPFGNISFLARRAFAATPTGDTIAARVVANPSTHATHTTWSVSATVGSVRSVSPANRKGPTLSFIPDPPAHDPYVRGTNCANPGNGSCARSASLSYTIRATIGSATFVRLPTQDEIDTIRQEYVNHGIDVPERDEFTLVQDTQHFDAARLNQTVYTHAVGDPGTLAEDVLREFNRRIFDDQQLVPVGAQVPPNQRIVGPGGNVVTVGALLGTRPCWPSAPTTCDDQVVGEYIVAGPDGRADTRARNEDAGFPTLTINSSWRNPERNEAVGGVLNSNHQRGNAIDFNDPPAFDVFTRAEMICMLEEAGNAAGSGIAEIDSAQTVCTNANVTHVHVQR